MKNKEGTFEEELIKFEKRDHLSKAHTVIATNSERENYDFQISIDSIDTKQIKESKFDHGLQHSVIRKFRRGSIPVFKEIDMHGLKFHEAIRVLNESINHIIETKTVCVLFIHGKGLGSINQTPIIKPLVKQFLSCHPRILAYTPAPKKLGGEGATLALIRRIRRR